MPDINFGIQLPVFSCKHTHAHHILKCKMPAGFIAVDLRFGNKGWPGYRVHKIQIGGLCPDGGKPEHRIYRKGVKALLFIPALPIRQAASQIQGKNFERMKKIALVAYRNTLFYMRIASPKNREAFCLQKNH